MVIHVGDIDKLDDLSQQSGRAGRDGMTASESIVLQAQKVNRQGKAYKVRTGFEELEMIEYLGGKRCRRAMLDGDMDGEDTRKGCRAGEETSDVCGGESKKRVRTTVGEEEGQVKRVRLEDSTPSKHRQTAQQQASRLAEERDREETARRQQDERDREAAVRREAARALWMEEQQSRQAMQARQQHRTVNYASMSEDFVALSDRWSVGRNVCRVSGRSVERKGWRICGCMSAEEHERIDRACNWLKAIRWEAAWTACQWCWAPQAICHSWQAVHDHGPTRYRKSVSASTEDV